MLGPQRSAVTSVLTPTASSQNTASLPTATVNAGESEQQQKLKFKDSLQPVYDAVLSILGDTGTILAIGDPNFGLASEPSFSSTGQALTFTWTKPPNKFERKLDLSKPASMQGIVPVLSFNGNDEGAQSPDLDYWSIGNGTTDTPVSIGMWIKPRSSGTHTLLGKWSHSANSAKEWVIEIESSGLVQFTAHDFSPGGYRVATSAPNRISSGSWTFLVFTYDGARGRDALAASETQWYFNGEIDGATTRSTTNGYVAVENGPLTVEFAMESGIRFYQGEIAGGPLGPFFTHKVLAAIEVQNLYQAGLKALGLENASLTAPSDSK
ncbi:MAG: hypothetical protein HY680_10615 [Chloroflexi bacterium]|nr:hypothetical protein [Chloroflexota bacterium]